MNQWRYINTIQNPADLATRNRSPKKVFKDSLWISGPKFLSLPEDSWPIWKIPQVNGFEIEMVPLNKAQMYVSITCGSVVDTELVDRSSDTIVQLSPQEKLFLLLWKFSSLDKLLRILGWLARLSSKDTKGLGSITSKELEAARSTAIHLAQLEYYSPKVLSQIKKKGFAYAYDHCVDNVTKGRLKPLGKLSPFLDEHQILRVGGRLQNSDIPNHMKHPIILPPRHHVTKLIIEEDHSRNRHFGGISYVLNNMQTKYYVGSATVKYYLDRCIPCMHIRAKTANQVMAPLPAARVSHGGHPFEATGVDYFGPVTVRVNRSHPKRWVALFTCLATRAVHLEIVNSLTTSSFLQAFFRFRCTRGNTVKVLYSDNATTFHGADAELIAALKRLDAEGY